VALHSSTRGYRVVPAVLGEHSPPSPEETALASSEALGPEQEVAATPRVGSGAAVGFPELNGEEPHRPPATEATASRQLSLVAVSDDVVGRPCSASSTASART
jgi:hypothetical protein